MATTTMTHDTTHETTPSVIGGVDTHRDTHTAAALDTTGRLLATATFPATHTGYQQLLAWLGSFGPVREVGVEGTGAYGAGLTRYLSGQRVRVAEIDRPDRATRRARGKSDPIDAEAAARTVFSAHRRLAVPKHRCGATEALRVLRVARNSAVQARKVVLQQIHALLVTAPEPLREQLRALRPSVLIATCAAQDPAVLSDPAHIGDPATATRLALHHLARRHQHLSREITDSDAVITGLVDQINPTLQTLTGVGPDCAGQLLVTAGANWARLRSEAAFARLCGVAPIPASSGRTDRHRLHRGGDRQANAALYRIVLSRLRWDDRTQAYMARRTAQGLSKKDIIRCLKRYVAREVYTVLTSMDAATSTA